MNSSWAISNFTNKSKLQLLQLTKFRAIKPMKLLLKRYTISSSFAFVTLARCFDVPAEHISLDLE